MAWSDLKKPYVCLAPMDGITNTAFRQIVRKVSKRVILFSEFTNVDGLIRSEYVRQRLNYHPSEHPFFMQIFGSNPDSFAEAACMIEDRGVMGIDINMGCPAKKVVHSQHGSALMKDVDQACRIVESVRKSCSLQVSVKTRLGWNNSDNLIPFCRRLESAGVSLLTIHGRTYKQGFKGDANWDAIYDLKNNVNIPVLGNGDVEDYYDGCQHMNNLDGFMIGRRAIGNPWVFQDCQKYPQPDLSTRITVALEHYDLLRMIKPEHIALKEFRKYLGGYIQGFAHAKAFRCQLIEASDEKSFIHLLEEMKMKVNDFHFSQAS
ncbi:MAG: tRNA-dihydrouridine synthase family protein [SAR324 cluster bacterium]|nr:tRNA-dihydrouridine synthase family protein [SAR324 cluster bacterium]